MQQELFIVLLAAAACYAQTTTTTNRPAVLCSYDNNTLGTCGCDNQLWINHDCTEGFFCMDSSLFPNDFQWAEGCSISCHDDEIVWVDTINHRWSCIPRHNGNTNVGALCPGAMHIECPGNGDIGECECEGQLWVNENCTEAFYCNSTMAGGGVDITCGPGQIVEVNPATHTWQCITDDGRCPGAFHVGCEAPPTTQRPVTLCRYDNNTLGDCECNKQLFMNEDCTEGFYCMDGGFPAGVEADGCSISCHDDEIVFVDTINHQWSCIPRHIGNNNVGALCPGKMNIECPGNGGIGDCQCEGQLWVNENCTEAFYCNSTMAGGGVDITCGPGEIVDVNPATHTWQCIQDDGRCPGGFHVGCQHDPTTTASPTTAPDGAVATQATAALLAAALVATLKAAIL